MKTTCRRLLEPVQPKVLSRLNYPIMRQSSSSATTTTFDGCFPFTVHSTYRHKETGQPLRPIGLQWNLPGHSHVTYVSMLGGKDSKLKLEQLLGDSDEWRVKRGIVEAHNRWAFAREENFAKVEDIDGFSLDKDGEHITVDWKPTLRERLFQEEGFIASMADVIKKDPAAVQGGEVAEVWINGMFVGTLCGPETVLPILEALSNVTSRRLAYKRSADGIIRIERYFGSYLRQKNEIFDHVMDNLIAMEDIEALDTDTLIGTATLSDWIMGGTSDTSQETR